MEKEARHYHHGDLQQAALEQALRIVEAGGVEAVTMREIAKRLGVTHRALYRWYSDREALLDQMAAAGLNGLAASLQDHPDKPTAKTRDLFVRGYLTFALSRPATYALAMSRSREALKRSPAYKSASDSLIALGVSIFESSGDAGRDYIMAMVSMLHGLWQLYRVGMLDVGSEEAFLAYGQTLAAQINEP